MTKLKIWLFLFSLLGLINLAMAAEEIEEGMKPNDAVKLESCFDSFKPICTATSIIAPSGKYLGCTIQYPGEAETLHDDMPQIGCQLYCTKHKTVHLKFLVQPCK